MRPPQRDAGSFYIKTRKRLTNSGTGNANHKPGCTCPFHKGARNGEPETDPLRPRPTAADIEKAREARIVAIKEDILANGAPSTDGSRRKDKFSIQKALLNADTLPEDLPAEPKNTPSTQKREDRSPKAWVAKWIRLRAVEPNITTKECASRFGISTAHLSNMIALGRREGWLCFDDPMLQIEHEIIPKVTRNLSQMLDDGNEKVTLETAKATIFPAYRDSKGIKEVTNTVIALKFEAPPEGSPTASGVIVGRPKSLTDFIAPDES